MIPLERYPVDPGLLNEKYDNRERQIGCADEKGASDLTNSNDKPRSICSAKPISRELFNSAGEQMVLDHFSIPRWV
jgi:hypothetical protein